MKAADGVSEFDQFSATYAQVVDASVAITGETSEYFAAYKARFIAQRVISRPDCKILDYGCGVGLVCAQLKKHVPGAHIEGYDVSEASLQRVDPLLRAQGVFASRIGALSGNYDVVFFANVLHHIAPKERQGAVSEAVELLGRGGKLVIFEHNPRNPLTRRAVERCPFDEKAVLLPPRESRAYLERSGSRGVRLVYIVFFPHALRWFRSFEKFLGSCPLGAQYAVTGSRV
jgi:2-polyprenyl-3-methyl-5-hydroxy-6-metoxy-1,4-benzoquinol methylase